MNVAMSEEELRTADDSILEPLAAYKTKYESAFSKSCEEYFRDLVERSGIDAAANRATVSKYDAEARLADAAGGRLSRYKAVKIALIVLIVLCAVLLFAGILLLVQGNTVVGAVLTAVGPSVIAGAVVLIAVVLSPRIKRSKADQSAHREKAEGYLHEAWKQMERLNALFENNVTKKLIERTVPLLELDDYFDVRRYDYLNGKYGYAGDPGNNASTVGILTGEILGNPFVVDRVLVHTMGSHTYFGSIVITWVTYETNSEGRSVPVHHSQTLTASVTRPKPCYRRETRLVYGNEAAPDLHFSRRPSHVEDLDEGARERKVKKGVGKIRKQQKKAMKSGKSFTEMGNEEFDVLFGAIDRDNDVEFRLLFTPLAQRNMVALLTDSERFGDDFYMRKAGCLNYIMSEHSAAWDMDERRENYLSYSFERAKNSFMQFNMQYFRSLYFDLAPLLSIPLYQQHKPHEYLYHESYPRNFTVQETEYAVNRIEESAFAPRGAATPCILKTSFLSKDGKSDRVRVTASAYREVPHTEFVPVFGGDGHMHSVPVDWIEYVPIAADTDVELKEIGLSDREFRIEAEGGKYSAALAKHGKYAYGYSHGIVCCVVPEEDSGFDGDFTIEK